MNSSQSDPQVTNLRPLDGGRPIPTGALRCRLVGIEQNGMLRVRTPGNVEIACDWLECNGTAQLCVAVGDELLVVVPDGATTGVITGRIGRYPGSGVASRVVIEAGETITFKCGESSVKLQADGKVLIKGEDVLVRAKGTQRIRAGTVSIN